MPATVHQTVNVDVTGDVTVKCHDMAVSQCCHFAVSWIILCKLRLSVSAK
jgi:hypothetical protein